EPVSEQVVGRSGRAALGAVAGIGEPEMNHEEGGGEVEQEPQTGGGGDEAVPLHQAAPAHPPGASVGRFSVPAGAATRQREAQPVDAGGGGGEQRGGTGDAG